MFVKEVSFRNSVDVHVLLVSQFFPSIERMQLRLLAPATKLISRVVLGVVATACSLQTN